MLNHITVIGRVCKTPELNRTQKGTAVTSFSLACDRDFKEADGHRETDFFECEAWNERAEHICTYFAKGRLVCVRGRMQKRKFKKKDGTLWPVWYIRVDDFYMLDNRKNLLESEDQLPKPDATFPQNVDMPDSDFAVLDEDLPLPWET